MKAFFAHQSVGADIVAGIDDLARAQPSRAQAVELANAHSATTVPLLIIHHRVGVNREPLTKIAAFREHLDAKQRLEVDVAMLKFCYVDIATQRDAQELWPHYQSMIEELSTARPFVRLVHCAVPLRTLPSGPYAWLRRAMGHRHPAFDANRAREWFNDRLRQNYAASGSLFDLAALEARRADGRLCKQANVPALAPEWTYDGGHLNERGRTMAAAAFLEFLQALQVRKR